MRSDALNKIYKHFMYRIVDLSFNFQKSSQNMKNNPGEYSNNLSNEEQSKKIYSVSFQKENNRAGLKSLSQPVLISNNVIQDSLENIHKEQSVFLYIFYIYIYLLDINISSINIYYHYYYYKSAER